MKLVGPAKLPAAEVARIHEGFVAAFATPEVKAAMARQGNDIDPSTPEAAAEFFFQSEMGRYGRLVKKANIQID
jgi:tripartite-type tricarboxylate transporter receptor subunit TctC